MLSVSVKSSDNIRYSVLNVCPIRNFDFHAEQRWINIIR